MPYQPNAKKLSKFERQTLAQFLGGGVNGPSQKSPFHGGKKSGLQFDGQEGGVDPTLLALLTGSSSGLVTPPDGIASSETMSPLAQLSNALGPTEAPTMVAPQVTIAAKAMPKGPSVNSELQQLMQAITSPGGNSPDYETALKAAEDQINKAYGADIGAVKHSSGVARKQTRKDREQVESMYRALSNSYARAGGREATQGSNLAKQIQGVSKQSGNQVNDRASQLLDDQAALAKGLGVQSAEPTVAAPQIAAATKESGNIAKQGSRDASNQLQYSGNARRSLNAGGQGAVLEGTNKSSDLLTQLESYLQGNDSKIADLHGQASLAKSSAASSIASSQASAEQKAHDDIVSQGLAALKLKLEIGDTRADNRLGREKLAAQIAANATGGKTTSEIPKGIQGASSNLAMGNHPKKLSAIFNALLHDPQGNFDTGHQTLKGDDGSTTSIYLTPTEAANEAEKAARAQGYSDPKDIAAIRNAAIAYILGTR